MKKPCEGEQANFPMFRLYGFRSLSILERALCRLEDYGVIAALSAMTLLYSLSIFSRYIIKVSMPWTDEIVMFLFIWATFLGASIGVRKGFHLGVSVLQNSLPPKWKRHAALLIGAVCIFTCGVLAWQGLRMVHLQFTMGQKSSQLGVPIFWVGLAIPVGLALALVRFAQALLGSLRR
jgi:TRAP-type C4-dicarboxylate transport system permease small subunit